MKHWSSMTPIELGDSGSRDAVDDLIGFLMEGAVKEKCLAVPSLLRNLGDKGPPVRQYSLKALLDLEVSPAEGHQVREALAREDRDCNKILLERLLEKIGALKPGPDADVSEPPVARPRTSEPSATSTPMTQYNTMNLCSIKYPYTFLGTPRQEHFNVSVQRLTPQLSFPRSLSDEAL